MYEFAPFGFKVKLWLTQIVPFEAVMIGEAWTIKVETLIAPMPQPFTAATPYV